MADMWLTCSATRTLGTLASGIWVKPPMKKCHALVLTAKLPERLPEEVLTGRYLGSGTLLQSCPRGVGES